MPKDDSRFGTGRGKLNAFITAKGLRMKDVMKWRIVEWCGVVEEGREGQRQGLRHCQHQQKRAVRAQRNSPRRSGCIHKGVCASATSNKIIILN